MQGTARLSKRQLIVLVITGILAVGSMVAAPQDSVSEMFAKMSGKVEGADNLRVSRPGPFPNISFTDAKGERVSIDSFKGKAVLINFWALWCAPCKIEKPKLEKLAADFGGDDFEVLTLSDGGDNMEVVKQYYINHGYKHLKPASDTGSMAFRTLELRGLPTTIILNKKGEEVAMAEGPIDWDSASVRQFLEGLIKN